MSRKNNTLTLKTPMKKRPRSFALDEPDYYDPTVGVGFSPMMNKYQHTDDSTGSSMVTIMFGFPGLKSDDISINLLHDKLIIAGEAVEPRLGEGKCHRITSEFPCGKFSRVVNVPLGMRVEDFKARMENGLLVVTYPKNAPKQEPHQIPIE